MNVELLRERITAAGVQNRFIQGAGHTAPYAAHQGNTRTLYSQLRNGCEAALDLGSAPMTQRDTGASAFREAVRDRLEEAFEILPVKRKDVGVRLGWTEQKMSNWLSRTGKTQIPLYELARFCQEFGFSADFIIFGNVSTLSWKLADDLAKARREKKEA